MLNLMFMAEVSASQVSGSDIAAVADRGIPFAMRLLGIVIAGILTENYVLQQLAGKAFGAVHYWAERSDREIDFVIQYGDNAVPVEVKSGGDKRASSFNDYVNSKKPKFAIRFSERNLKKDGAFVNIPLYLVPRFAECLQ